VVLAVTLSNYRIASPIDVNRRTCV